MEKYQLKNVPVGEVYYYPNFISPYEEQQLLQQVYNVPHSKWTQLTNRRLQNWGGNPHPSGMIVQPLPQWLLSCIGQITRLGIFDDKIPNHVLVNEYKPNEGIMPHLDGPLYHPVIATVNLGSHTALNFYREDNRNEVDFSLFLEPRSLLIQRGEIYYTLLHGIDEKYEDIIDQSMLNVDELHPQYGQSIKRDVRVSLTIRHVPKISKLKIQLGK